MLVAIGCIFIGYLTLLYIKKAKIAAYRRTMKYRLKVSFYKGMAELLTEYKYWINELLKALNDGYGPKLKNQLPRETDIFS